MEIDISENFPKPFADFGDLFTSIIGFALAAAGLVFFFLLIWGGIRYLTAGGDDKAVDSARGTLTSAAIGLIIVVGAFIIINIVLMVFSTRPAL